MKTFFRTIHLYLSLVSGLVIAVVCFTGGVLVFEKELDQAWHPDRFFVTPTGGQPLSLARLTEAVKATVPNAKITGIKVYADPARTAEVSLAGPKKDGEGKPGREGQAQGASQAKTGQLGAGGKKEAPNEGGGGPKIYVNPYTAAVVDQVNYRDTFFFTMMALHRGMVGGPIGKLVVGVSTLFFLFIIGTGIVLWWPATRKAVRQRFTVKWEAGWKRLNHDLHIVLGFYSALFLFVFAFTGLAWSFEWFNNGIFAVTRSDPKGPEAPKSTGFETPKLSLETPNYDLAYAVARKQVPGAFSYAISAPKDFTEAFRVVTTGPQAAYEGATDELYLNQYNGQVLGKLNFDDRNLGQRVRRTFKPVHTGAIFGLPSKIVAVVVCLLGTTFPITGVILWLNRLKKNRKKARKQVAVSA
ncbi:PepSY domain-containing protein [Hymenobacter sp. BT175]|uniref:PepSY-associated TM helix domain-containing protein n=1 Tax=Hymenobacter translucens TaxID=2886507 RepID=UPI001D0E5A3E|nr:PepSY-associated TM helix domain-containing protein [Hymenobacter translucens]MCC2546520.1 PepSY domain-containing protein [Hymenobacter translucens]